MWRLLAPAPWAAPPQRWRLVAQRRRHVRRARCIRGNYLLVQRSSRCCWGGRQTCWQTYLFQLFLWMHKQFLSRSSLLTVKRLCHCGTAKRNDEITPTTAVRFAGWIYWIFSQNVAEISERAISNKRFTRMQSRARWTRQMQSDSIFSRFSVSFLLIIRTTTTAPMNEREARCIIDVVTRSAANERQWNEYWQRECSRKSEECENTNRSPKKCSVPVDDTVQNFCFRLTGNSI